MRQNIAFSELRRFLALSVTAALTAFPAPARGQTDSAAQRDAETRSHWRRFALGFAGSILAHETAHFAAAISLGAKPHVGFDKGRPTVFSGINSEEEPRKQFIFSASGLTTQWLINEAILDFPHNRGSSLERGFLAGGIATTLFYVTIGRNGSVSDVSYMERTSSLSKTQISLIFGGLSAVQWWRITRNPAYSHFFVAPRPTGLAAGLAY